MAQQLNCFGLSVDVKKMTKELVNSRLCKENCQVTVVLTKAENNRGNYTSTQNILLDDIIINYSIQRGG